MPERRRSLRPAIGACVIAALVAVPLVLPAYPVSVVTGWFGFALLAISLDLLVGFGGLVSLGQAAYFGVGANTAALVGLHVSTDAALQFAAATLAGAIAAALTGWALVRTRGTYFLIMSLAVGVLVHQVADSWSNVTGGTDGLPAAASATLLAGRENVAGPASMFWYALAVFVLVLLAVRVLANSRFGLVVKGMRANEERMRALGHRPAPVYFGAFCLAGAVAGGGGALWVLHHRFVSPADLDLGLSAMALLAVVIGGRGTLWGPSLAAALILLVRDVVPTVTGGRGVLLLGCLLVLAVYLQRAWKTGGDRRGLSLSRGQP